MESELLINDGNVLVKTEKVSCSCVVIDEKESLQV